MCIRDCGVAASEREEEAEKALSSEIQSATDPVHATSSQCARAARRGTNAIMPTAIAQNACVANFTRVCVESGTLWFDETSTCDGTPCREGQINISRFPQQCEEDRTTGEKKCVMRFMPGWRTAWRSRLNRVSATSALLPSGIDNTITQPLTNMAHLLHDHFMHEVDIARMNEIRTVLGQSHADELNIVLALRARLFGRATFQPTLSGCFARL